MLGKNLDDILLILSRKNSEKLDAIIWEHENVGRMEGGLRESSDSRPAHSFLGFFWFWETKLLKYIFLEHVINLATFLAWVQLYD